MATSKPTIATHDNLDADEMVIINFEAVAHAERPRRGPALALWVEMRPKQWVKNLACLAGLVFSGRLFLSESIGRGLAGFGAFCCASSALYIVNDFFDRGRDRLNPRTAGRPLASGDLPFWLALVACLALIAAAGAASWQLGAGCVAIIALYAAMNVVYTLRLKQTVIADVMCIALGFVLRVLYGVYAVAAVPTAWIVLCIFFLALFLGFGKRKAELLAHGANSASIRPVLRKYRGNFLDLMLGMSATMTILCYALFTVASQKNPTLIVTIVPVVYCVTRYLLQIMVNGRGESPDEILLSDKLMWLGILAWLALCVIILYAQVNLFVDTVEWPRVK